MINVVEYASFASEMFELPAAVIETQSMLNDEKASLEDFVNVVKFDPMLAITKNRQFSFISLTWAGEFSSKCSQNIRNESRIRFGHQLWCGKCVS